MQYWTAYNINCFIYNIPLFKTHIIITFINIDHYTYYIFYTVVCLSLYINQIEW